jgi:hypothetical protein
MKNPDDPPSHRMTSMLLTRKIRITPTAKQAKILWALSEKCRLLYNFALTERRHQWIRNRTKPATEYTPITYIQLQNALPDLKAQYPEYIWVYSKVLQMTLRRLDADYKSFFARWRRGDQYHDPVPIAATPCEQGAITSVLGWLASTHSPTPSSPGSGLNGSPCIHAGVVHSVLLLSKDLNYSWG